MTGFAVRQEHAPTIDDVEADAERLRGELERLLDAARDKFRRVQDVEAELADVGEAEAGGAIACRHKVLYDLRVIRRQLERAQAILVPVDDERRGPAVQALGWIDEAEREDRPWRAEAA